MMRCGGAWSEGIIAYAFSRIFRKLVACKEDFHE